ncbi:MAG: tetrahydrofolate dehydrogenase/cyclohydrolase catalytic domain-containing protein [Bacteroidota bacterium]
MQLIDGKRTAANIREQIAEDVKVLLAKGGRAPHLVAVLVGNDGASQTYVNGKMKACELAGFKSSIIRYDEDIAEEKLLNTVNELNEEAGIDGFIVQLPLPAHISEKKVTEAIKPEKDVDGFHPANIGKMVLNLPTFLPATPFGIIQLLKHYNIDTSGKHCVIVGRSHIVGTPMALLMSRKDNPGNCTVTIAHSRTKDLKAETLRADILIAALGRPGFITADMVKEGAVVIDVGTTRVPDASKKRGYAVKGDVLFEEVAEKCSYITPVPGGVGPMTIVSLLKNTLISSKKRQGIED